VISELGNDGYIVLWKRKSIYDMTCAAMSAAVPSEGAAFPHIMGSSIDRRKKGALPCA